MLLLISRLTTENTRSRCAVAISRDYLLKSSQFFDALDHPHVALILIPHGRTPALHSLVTSVGRYAPRNAVFARHRLFLRVRNKRTSRLRGFSPHTVNHLLV